MPYNLLIMVVNQYYRLCYSLVCIIFTFNTKTYKVLIRVDCEKYYINILIV